MVDETWASTNMARRTGRSPRGEPLVCSVPHGHWKTTTFVAALRTTGMTAPTVIDGAMTGDLFVAYVRQQLARLEASGASLHRYSSPSRLRLAAPGIMLRNLRGGRLTAAGRCVCLTSWVLSASS